MRWWLLWCWLRVVALLSDDLGALLSGLLVNAAVKPGSQWAMACLHLHWPIMSNMFAWAAPKSQSQQRAEWQCSRQHMAPAAEACAASPAGPVHRGTGLLQGGGEPSLPACCRCSSASLSHLALAAGWVKSTAMLCLLLLAAQRGSAAWLGRAAPPHLCLAGHPVRLVVRRTEPLAGDNAEGVPPARGRWVVR